MTKLDPQSWLVAAGRPTEEGAPLNVPPILASNFTFGGDRETFDFTDLTNYLNVDNDVWRFSPPIWMSKP